MNILVTGGAGFVGAHLVNKLVVAGYNVTVVDTLSGVGGIPYLHPDAGMLIEDIRNPRLYERLGNNSYDVVFHLAGAVGSEPAYEDPKSDLLANAYSTYLLSRYCIEHNVKHIIYSSSVAVYGDTSTEALTEESTIDPDSFYGVSKYAGEMFIKQVLKGSRTRYTIFRLTNNYGPGELLTYRKKGMVSIYASYIWKNEPIEVKGSLDRFRNFTYIADTRDILFDAMLREQAFDNTYNLSIGIRTTVRELISTMLSVAGKKSDYHVKELPVTPEDSFGFHFSAEKLRRDFGWVPSMELREGLKEYFDWIEQVPVSDDISKYHPFMLTKSGS